jgi:ABC-2 type transport system ATP-binding protein
MVLPRLFESATRLGVRVTSVEIQEPNLEAVFLHLTGRALRDE